MKPSRTLFLSLLALLGLTQAVGLSTTAADAATPLPTSQPAEKAASARVASYKPADGNSKHHPETKQGSSDPLSPATAPEISSRRPFPTSAAAAAATAAAGAGSAGTSAPPSRQTVSTDQRLSPTEVPARQSSVPGPSARSQSSSGTSGARLGLSAPGASDALPDGETTRVGSGWAPASSLLSTSKGVLPVSDSLPPALAASRRQAGGGRWAHKGMAPAGNNDDDGVHAADKADVAESAFVAPVDPSPGRVSASAERVVDADEARESGSKSAKKPPAADEGDEGDGDSAGQGGRGRGRGRGPANGDDGVDAGGDASGGGDGADGADEDDDEPGDTPPGGFHGHEKKKDKVDPSAAPPADDPKRSVPEDEDEDVEPTKESIRERRDRIGVGNPDDPASEAQRDDPAAGDADGRDDPAEDPSGAAAGEAGDNADGGDAEQDADPEADDRVDGGIEHAVYSQRAAASKQKETSAAADDDNDQVEGDPDPASKQSRARGDEQQQPTSDAKADGENDTPPGPDGGNDHDDDDDPDQGDATQAPDDEADPDGADNDAPSDGWRDPAEADDADDHPADDPADGVDPEGDRADGGDEVVVGDDDDDDDDVGAGVGGGGNSAGQPDGERGRADDQRPGDQQPPAADDDGGERGDDAPPPAGDDPADGADAGDGADEGNNDGGGEVEGGGDQGENEDDDELPPPRDRDLEPAAPADGDGAANVPDGPAGPAAGVGGVHHVGSKRGKSRGVLAPPRKRPLETPPAVASSTGLFGGWLMSWPMLFLYCAAGFFYRDSIRGCLGSSDDLSLSTNTGRGMLGVPIQERFARWAKTEKEPLLPTDSRGQRVKFATD